LKLQIDKESPTTNHDFFNGNFDQKVPLLDTSKKNNFSHFGQVVFDMIDLIGGLFD
jgi:hypothetical protein